MQGLEEHYFRFTSDELFNGLPAQLVDEWSTWGVKAAMYARQLATFKKSSKFIMLPIFIFPLLYLCKGPKNNHHFVVSGVIATSSLGKKPTKLGPKMFKFAIQRMRTSQKFLIVQ